MDECWGKKKGSPAFWFIFFFLLRITFIALKFSREVFVFLQCFLFVSPLSIQSLLFDDCAESIEPPTCIDTIDSRSKLPPRTPLSSIFLTKSTRAFLSLWRLVDDINTSEKESDETLDKRPVDVLDNDCYQTTWSAVTKLNERALFGVMSTRILMKRRCAWEIN